MTDRRFGPLTAAAVLAAAFSLGGCAAAMMANRRMPGTYENGEFKPQRPPQANYGADPKLTCPGGGAPGALQADIEMHGGAKKAQQDGRLCAMADTLLGWKTESDAELPPDSVRAFLSQYFGVPGSVRRLLMSSIETEDPKNISTAVIDSVTSFAAGAEHPLYGMMSERVKKGTTRVVVVYYDSLAEIEPLPKTIALNSSATLSGTLNGDLTKPRIEIVDPVGKLQKPEQQPGKAFKAELKCGDKPGKMLIQIVAEKEGADTLVTNFPVYCGTQPPVAVKVPAATKGPVDLPAGEKQIAQSINDDRKAAGLKPLNVLPALSDLARNLAQKRAEGKGITSAELTKGLKDADIAAPLVLESMAQSLSIDDAYTRFSDSPSDRSNIMNGEVTDMGVGVVNGPKVGDRATYITAALFVKQRAPIDPAQLKSKLYEAIDKKRSDARVGAAERDPVLEKVAQQYAEAAAANGGRPTKEQETEIFAPLYKQSMTVNQVGGFLPDETTAMEVAEQPAIVGSNKLVGVGVAVGNSPQFGKGSPFVMVLTGTRHAAPKPAKRAPRHR